jgi:hypothetical protein
MLFQNCVSLVELVPGSYSEPCNDDNQCIDVKFEEVADIKEEKGPLLAKLPVINTEHEVSFMSVCPLSDTFDRYLLLLYYVPCMSST